MSTPFRPTIGVLYALNSEYRGLKALDSSTFGVERKGHLTPSIIRTHGRTLKVVRALAYDMEDASRMSQGIIDAFPSVQMLFFVGIAGGVPFESDGGYPKIGDIVVSTYLANIGAGEVLPTTFAARPDVINASGKLLELGDLKHGKLADDFREDWGREYSKYIADVGYVPSPPIREVTNSIPFVRAALIASSSQRMSNAETRDNWVARFRAFDAKNYKLQAFEMEGHALANAANKEGKLFLVIRSISDWSDGKERARERKQFANLCQVHAAYSAAAFFNYFLGLLPKEESPEPHDYSLLPKYRADPFEETRPIRKSDLTGLPAFEVERAESSYLFARREFEQRLLERYWNERVIEYQGVAFPLSIPYSGLYEMEDITCVKSEDYFEVPPIVKTWNENGQLIAFMRNNPLCWFTQKDLTHVRILNCTPGPSNSVRIHLQRAHYEGYIATNLAMDVKDLRTGYTLRDHLQSGEDGNLSPLENSQCCNPLGICCMVESSDKFFPLVLRSPFVANARQTWAPSASGGTRVEGKFKWEKPSVLDSILNHLEQEVGITQDHVAAVVHTGLTREFERGGMTDFHFYVKTKIDIGELKKRIASAPHHIENIVDSTTSVKFDKLSDYLGESASPALNGSVFLLLKLKSDDKFLRIRASV